MNLFFEKKRIAMGAKGYRGLLLLFLFLLSGCAETEPRRTESAMIVWKTPQLRYADMGFISDDGRMIDVEIYGSGRALMQLKINEDSICMGRLSCMSKTRFNQAYLSSAYPPDILADIFRGKPIFGGAGMQKKRNGFTQKLRKDGRFDIEYHVFNNQIVFRDTIGQISIKVSKQ